MSLTLHRGNNPFMAVLPMARMMDEMLSECPYPGFHPLWHEPDRMGLDMAKDLHIINDKDKFAVDLDVSHFRPEELKVNVDGRELTIEGMHDEETESGFARRAFTRCWTLPEDVDLNEIESNLSQKGHLQIEARKVDAKHVKPKSIPIMRSKE